MRGHSYFSVWDWYPKSSSRLASSFKTRSIPMANLKMNWFQPYCTDVLALVFGDRPHQVVVATSGKQRRLFVRPWRLRLDLKAEVIVIVESSH